MFTEYNREFDQQLDKVVKTFEAFEKALQELHRDFHSLNEYEVDTADLTQVDYTLCDLQGFMIDEIGTLRKQQDGLPGKYDTYDYQEMANDNRLTDRCMGLEIGRK